MTTPARHSVTEMLLTLLRRGTGKQVGDYELPADAEYPYAILYPIPGGGFDGPPLQSSESDALFTYQVTSVGLSRKQAEWMGDRVRATVVARSANGAFQVAHDDPDGLRIASRMVESGAGGVDVQGDPPHRVYSVAERFSIRVTPR